jgi:gamma-glutamyl hydrolase
MKYLPLLIYISSFCCYLCSPDLPVIAVYANPLPDNSEDYKEEYVQQRYVRWIEQSGGVTTIIHTWSTHEEIDEILSKANGVLWQGGDRDIDLSKRWEQTALYIFQKIKQINDDGKYLPFWPTCQGFELLVSLLAGTPKILSKYNAWNVALPLIFDTKSIKETKLFREWSDSQLYNLGNKPTTMHWHHLGISVEDFSSNEEIKNTLRITTLGKDSDGKIFVATYEGIKYPIYSPQFHPEKVPYDKIEGHNTPRTLEAIQISQNFGNFFIEEARKSPSKNIDKRLIFDSSENYNLFTKKGTEHLLILKRGMNLKK